MNTYMKMSAKDHQNHRDFLNSLRQRLNVDDQTIANLEKRITGKFSVEKHDRPEKLAVKSESAHSEGASDLKPSG